jgi:hypothetical protein
LLRFALLIACSLVALPTLGQQKRFQTGLLLQYELRARDVKVGTAVVTVGPKQTVAGKATRAVTIEGKSSDLVGFVYSGTMTATSWLAASDWSPVKARWRNRVTRNISDTDTNYDGKRIQATFLRPDKPPFTLDQSFDKKVQDLVSMLPWIVQQKVKQGAKFQTPIYTGMQVCQLHGEVGKPEAVTLPLGARETLPVALHFSECHITRTATVWLDKQDWTPHRIVVTDKLLGSIEVVLRSLETTDVPPVDPKLAAAK